MDAVHVFFELLTSDGWMKDAALFITNTVSILAPSSEFLLAAPSCLSMCDLHMAQTQDR